MAQPIKYNTGTKTTGCCIRKGNYDIGIVQNREYGPTVNTGFWNGYDVPSGGFVSFQNKASQGPSIYNIPSESDIVAFGRQLNLGGNYTTPEAVIQRCAELNTIVMTNIEYPELPSIDNNILTLDAGYTASYPWAGNTWYDISGGEISTATLVGSTTWLSGNSIDNYVTSKLQLQSSNKSDWVSMNGFTRPLTEFTISVWIYPTSANFTQNVNIVGQRYADSGNSPYSDCNFLIRGNGSNGYHGLVRVNGTDYVVNTGAITINQWINIILTFGGGGLNIYVYNILKDTTNVPTPTTNNQETIIGGITNAITDFGASDDYFDGYVSSVNIYDVEINRISDLNDVYRPRF
jgi:hypothetical protein